MTRISWTNITTSASDGEYLTKGFLNTDIAKLDLSGPEMFDLRLRPSSKSSTAPQSSRKLTARQQPSQPSHNYQTLHAYGVEKKSPVKLSLTPVSMKQAFEPIGKAMAGKKRKHTEFQCTYTISTDCTNDSEARRIRSCFEAIGSGGKAGKSGANSKRRALGPVSKSVPTPKNHPASAVPSVSSPPSSAPISIPMALVADFATKLMATASDDVRERFQQDVSSWPDEQKRRMAQGGVDPLYFRFVQHAQMMAMSNQADLRALQGDPEPTETEDPKTRAGLRIEKEYERVKMKQHKAHLVQKPIPGVKPLMLSQQQQQNIATSDLQSPPIPYPGMHQDIAQHKAARVAMTNKTRKHDPRDVHGQYRPQERSTEVQAMPYVGPAKRTYAAAFTAEDDELLIDLKEKKGLTLDQIADFFPGCEEGLFVM